VSRILKLLLAALPALTAFAQSDPAPTVFRAETNLVLVRFQMTPKKGQSADLRPEDIELKEDGAVRRVALLQGGPRNSLTTPVEINLLLGEAPRLWADPSRQTTDLSALDAHPNVSIAVWGIGEKLIRFAAPTRDPRTLNQAIVKAWETSEKTRGSAQPLIPAYVAVLARAAAQGRTNVLRTLVVARRNCGGQGSEATEAMEAVREAGMAVFPLTLYTGSGSAAFSASRSRPDGRAPVNISAGAKGILESEGTQSFTADYPCEGSSSFSPASDDFLKMIAKATGGRTLSRDESTAETFNAFLEWLGDEILHDYIAGFYAASSGERKPHQIRIALKDSRRGQITGYAKTVVH